MADPPFPLIGANKEPIPSRSNKLSALMESKHYKELTASLPGVDSAIFELATLFWFGHEVKFSSETAIPLACAAYHLEIPNLLPLSISFFTNRVLPYWNETLRALNSATPILATAQHLGLVNACLRSISEKALADPTLLDDLNCDSTTTEDGKSGVKRGLFTIDRFVDDLTALPLDVYAPAMSAIISAGVPPERIAQSLYRYTRRWIDRKNMTANADDFEGDEIEKKRQREVVEAVERLLPSKKGAIHAHCLFEILRAAIYLQADTKCRGRLEARLEATIAAAAVMGSSEEEQEKRVVGGGGEDGQVEEDLSKIDNSVMELERECVKMKIEIEKGELEGGRKEGKGFWKGMKGLLRCRGAKGYSCPEMRKKHKKQKMNPKDGWAS